MSDAKDIFISFKSDGRSDAFAKILDRTLRDLGYSVFFSQHEKHSGPFPQEIERAVLCCQDFIALASTGYLRDLTRPDAPEKSWVRRELMLAKKSPGVKRIIRVNLDVRVEEFNEVLRADHDLAFFPDLNDITMPVTDFEESPLQKLLDWMLSEPRKESRYRLQANANSGYRAKDRLREEIAKAQSGDVTAMYRAGMMLYYGFASETEGKAIRDFKAAAYWLKRVADEGDGELKVYANMLLGRMYYAGAAVEQSYEESFRRYSLAEENPYAAQQIAFVRRIGCGCDYDYEGIEKYYLDAIERGDDFTKVGLALFYEMHGRFSDAVRTYLSMESPSPEANYHLGLIYRNGTHVSPAMPDYAKASECLQRAMDKGHTDAALELGTLYFRPTGTFKKDFRKAQECFEVAAQAGNAEAQYMLGYMFEFGHVREDLQESIRYFELSAAQGNLLSSAHLATLYQLVDPCNHELAFNHCKIAAEYGDSNSEYVLGNMYLLGRGCDPDVTLAKYYYQKALNHGFTQARLMLDLLEEIADENADSGIPSWLD